MVRLLYKLFPKAFNRLAFSSQHVNPNMEFAFVDSNGKKYYRYKNDLDLPMVRKGIINHFMTLLTSAITETELSEYLTLMRKAHEELLSAGKLKSKPFSQIGFLISQLEDRERWHIHPDLCYDLCAVVYLREDEKEGTVYDSNIHNEKVRQFRLDAATGLLDFFYISGWQTYLPYSNSSPAELKAYVKSMEPTVSAQQKMRSNLMSQYESSEQGNPS